MKRPVGEPPAATESGAALSGPRETLASDTPTLPGLPDKEYFRIGEAARLVGVKPYVLRYWEGEFRRDIRPDRSRSNQRMYRRKDVETFIEIKRLRYEEKLELPGARRRLRHGGPEEALRELPDVADVPLASDLTDGRAEPGALLPAAGGERSRPVVLLDDGEDDLLGGEPLAARSAGQPLDPGQLEFVRKGLEELLRIVDEDEKAE